MKYDKKTKTKNEAKMVIPKTKSQEKNIITNMKVTKGVQLGPTKKDLDF